MEIHLLHGQTFPVLSWDMTGESHGGSGRHSDALRSSSNKKDEKICRYAFRDQGEREDVMG